MNDNEAAVILITAIITIWLPIWIGYRILLWIIRKAVHQALDERQ